MKVLFLQGIPASGKTTYAKAYCEKNKDWVRVSRDDLRNMRGKYWMPKDEVMITVMERACIKGALEYGKNVIVDATNFNKKFVAQMKYEIDSWELGVEYETKRFNVSLETAIKRDLQRPNSVGEKVIKNFYKRYIEPVKQVQQDKSLPHVIICDLDGTLAIHNGRNPFEYDKCDTDIPNKIVISIVENYLSYGEGDVIFMSGREDSCKEKTRQWIKDYVQIMDREFQVHMRKTGDSRKDSIVKKELFDNHVRDKYFVDFILDDRDQVVEMWRDLGLICLQCAEGDF